MIARLPCDDLPTSRAAGGNERHARWALIVAIFGSVLASLDATGTGVALPTMEREFNASPAAVGWVAEGYALFLSALILVGGSLGDRFGRRRTFVIGVAGFGVSSLACAMAPTVGFLIAVRCLQGIAAALMIPGSLAIISAAFDQRGRGPAIGTWAAVSALSAAVGPPLGGWLTQSASWRWIFLLNVPIAILIAIVALTRVEESVDGRAPKNFDIAGAIFATAGLAGLTYGFVQLQAPLANRLLDALAIAAGIAALAMFARIEAVAPNPMIPRELFANRAFVSANAYTFVLYAALGGATYFMPFFLQFIRGYSPLESGCALLPFVAVMALGSRYAGGFFTQQRVRLALTIGPLCEAAAFLMFGLAPLDSSYWASYFPAAIAMGLGAAVFVAPLTTFAMNSARAHVGAGSGVNNAVSRAGSLLAVAVAGAIVFSHFSANVERTLDSGAFSEATRHAVRLHFDRIAAFELPAAVPASERAPLLRALREDYTKAFRFVMCIMAGASVAASVYAGVTIRSVTETGLETRPATAR